MHICTFYMYMTLPLDKLLTIQNYYTTFTVVAGSQSAAMQLCRSQIAFWLPCKTRQLNIWYVRATDRGRSEHWPLTVFRRPSPSWSSRSCLCIIRFAQLWQTARLLLGVQATTPFGTALRFSTFSIINVSDEITLRMRRVTTHEWAPLWPV